MGGERGGERPSGLRRGGVFGAKDFGQLTAFLRGPILLEAAIGFVGNGRFDQLIVKQRVDAPDNVAGNARAAEGFCDFRFASGRHCHQAKDFFPQGLLDSTP